LTTINAHAVAPQYPLQQDGSHLQPLARRINPMRSLKQLALASGLALCATFALADQRTNNCRTTQHHDRS
jgi:hypothetical protein